MSGQVTGDESLEELQDLVAKLQKNVDWLMDGNLSSKNVREIGDYQVGSTYLRSRDGDVGMSSANDASDPVRFWAGSATKDTAPWRVMKSGKMVATGVLIQNATGTVGISLENTPDDDVMLWAGSANKNTAPWRVYESGKSVMTGALIQSSNGTYPLIMMDPAGNLFGAYSAIDKNVRLEASNGTTSAPTLIFRDGSMSTFMYNDTLTSEFSIVSINGIQISVAGDLRLYGSKVRFENWNKLFSDGVGQTLQQALDAKASTSALSAKADVTYVNGFGINMGFDPGTRNLKLFAANGSTLATVNIP